MERKRDENWCTAIASETDFLLRCCLDSLKPKEKGDSTRFWWWYPLSNVFLFPFFTTGCNPLCYPLLPLTYGPSSKVRIGLRRSNSSMMKRYSHWLKCYYIFVPNVPGRRKRDRQTFPWNDGSSNQQNYKTFLKQHKWSGPFRLSVYHL